ncbi:hypothetical protein IG631_16978 [Alternaria alternata]|nr:hypothetical protein IG631_16978 [Alternaria alternata]
MAQEDTVIPEHQLSERTPVIALYPTAQRDGQTITRFLLSGKDTAETYKLDELFFENWYGYQDAVFVHEQPLSVVQVMSVSRVLRVGSD